MKNYLAANAVVQQFLSMLALDKFDFKKEVDKMLIPLAHLTKVLGLLVNPTVTEIHCASFVSIGGNRKFNNFLLKHALENCPKISNIEYLSKSNSCSVERLKKSWDNLKSIKSEDLICKEITLKLIKKKIPNLESVVVFIVDAETIFANFFESTES
jgi:hypothetical protein